MVQTKVNAAVEGKQAYESAKMEILHLSAADVIVTSVSAGDDSGDESSWTPYY